jgi:hypothetical protein
MHNSKGTIQFFKNGVAITPPIQGLQGEIFPYVIHIANAYSPRNKATITKGISFNRMMNWILYWRYCCNIVADDL